jgi:hypothetical protein
MKHRIRAGLIHLTLSAVVATAVFLPIYFYWYPDVLFESAGGRDLFLLIAGVDVTIGPLITFIIFKPGKKGLVFDLVAIAIVQAAALAGGVYVLFESRPVYIVFVKDRFELVRANQFPEGELAKSHARGYDDLPLGGPKLVAARIPKDPDEQFRMMISGFGGVDLQFYPQHYVPYDEARDDVRKAALPLETLRKRNPKRAPEVDAMLARLGRREDEVRYLPLRTGKAELAVFVDAKSGGILKISSLYPWSED